MAGDGRANENIGLTAVHHIFHAEHNRLVEHTKAVIINDATQLLASGATQAEAVAFLNEWLAVDVAAVPTTAGEIEPCSGMASACSRRRSSAPRCSTSTWCSRSSRARSSPRSMSSSRLPVSIPPSMRRSWPSSRTPSTASATRCCSTRSTGSIPNFVSSEIGLIDAFLNPLAFDQNDTLTPDEAAGAIVRGTTRQIGNAIDEFKTEALRNNLLGLPLDLASINLARGRDTGIPSLNAARADFYRDDRRQPAHAVHELGRLLAAHEAPGVAGQLHRRLRHARLHHQPDHAGRQARRGHGHRVRGRPDRSTPTASRAMATRSPSSCLRTASSS